MSKQSNSIHTKQATKRESLLVFGVIKIYQQLLDHQNNTFYIIPPIIKHTVLTFYSIKEEWNEALKSYSLSIVGYNITKTQTITGSSTVFGSIVVNRGRHEWTSKIICRLMPKYG